jgi:hypothetical protein
MRAVVTRATFTGSSTVIADLDVAKGDLIAAGSISDFNTTVDPSASGLTANIELAEG